jgi:hypothetical protein
MDVAYRSRRGWRTAAVPAVVALVMTIAPGRARARDDQQPAKPWLPMVEDGASPDDVYSKYSLSVVHVGDDGWRVNRGQYRESVSRKDFFVTVGRPDLAAREQSGSGARNGLIWSGVCVAVTGGVLMLAGISKGGWDPPPLWGLATMGVGIGLVWIGSGVHGPEVTSGEADAVVNRYNDLLKAHIEEETGTSKPKPIQARLELIAPFVDGRSGGGLMAVASF